jgi:hypothetical protein
VFWDELERIDRNLNSGSVLCQRRLRAYYEFRDRSEPVEKVAHTSGPRRAEIRIGDSRESDTGFARRPARRPARWRQPGASMRWPAPEPWAGRAA